MKHPQFIEGTLYVTQKQHRALTKQTSQLDYVYRPPVALGIPVVVMKSGVPITLPSGNTLVYSELINAFFVFDEEHDIFATCRFQ